MKNRAQINAACLTIVAVALSLALAGSRALAQGAPARLIPFQARLTGADGQPLADGVYPLTFRIYDAATGGVECWTEQHASASVIGGQLNVILGSLTKLDDPNNNSNGCDAVVFNPDGGIPDGCAGPPPTPAPTPGPCQGPGSRFLGISVGANAQEMVPRHQLVPSFHARRADISDDIIDGAVTTNKLANNSVTAGKVANNSISGAKIIDGSLQADDFPAGIVSSSLVADGSIRGTDIATDPPPTPGSQCNGITSANVCNGHIAAEDLAANQHVVRVSMASKGPGFNGEDKGTNILNAQAYHLLQWDEELDDPSDMHSMVVGQTNRLTAKMSGRYLVTVEARWATADPLNILDQYLYLIKVHAGGQREMVSRYFDYGDDYFHMRIVAEVVLSVGEYVEVYTSFRNYSENPSDTGFVPRDRNTTIAGQATTMIGPYFSMTLISR